MDMKNVLATISRMFPSVNLSGAVEKAEQAINGTADNLDSVSAAARSIGLDASAVNSIYNKYGSTMQARMICQMLGTTPEALKADADKIVGVPPMKNVSNQHPASTRFPRLK